MSSITAILQTEDGRAVQEIALPPFLTPPMVIIWGIRVFSKLEKDPRDNTYRECFCYSVPSVYAGVPTGVEVGLEEALDRAGALRPVGQTLPISTSEALSRAEVRHEESGKVFTRPECIFRYCPSPDSCQEACRCPQGRPEDKTGIMLSDKTGKAD